MAMIGIAVIGFVVAWFASEKGMKLICWGVFFGLLILLLTAGGQSGAEQARGSFLYQRFVAPTAGFLSGVSGFFSGVSSILFVMAPFVVGSILGRRANDWVEGDQ